MVLRLALYLAALGHDIGHSGKTNAYEAKAKSKLAIKYNDDAPLERYHAALMFRILMETKLSKVQDYEDTETPYRKSEPKQYEHFLDKLNKQEFQILRELMILLILRTDPNYHSLYIDNFTHYKEEVEQKKTGAAICFDLRKLEGKVDEEEKKVSIFLFIGLTSMAIQPIQNF